MKKILIVSDTFYPERTSGAKLLYDLTNELKKKNKILVISAKETNLIRFFRKKKIIKKNNIKIIFVPSLYIKNKNLILRGLSEMFLGLILWHKTKNQIKKFKPTSLIIYSPSIFYGYLIKKIKKIFKIKSLCIMRDVFPHWAIEVGYIKNIFLKKFFLKIFKSFIENFDNIGLEAQSNVKKFSKLYKNSKKKYFYLPNWINLNNYEFKKIKSKKNFHFLFGGNFGGGQDIYKVLNFYKKISGKFCEKFYFIGDGMSVSLLKNFLSHDNYKNVYFKKKISQLDYSDFIRKIDFGIISLNDKISFVNFPGRFFSYLLKNKPVIILSKKKNELSDFIEKNKIGLRYSDKMNINKYFKNLSKICLKLNDNKHVLNILEKNFSVQDISKLIISKI